MASSVLCRNGFCAENYSSREMAIIYTDQFILADWTRGSVADVFVLAYIARVALDRTAPDELAVALFFDVPDPRLIPAATAQQPATLDAVRCAIAESSSCAKYAEAFIFLTVIGRICDIHEIGLVHFLVLRILPLQFFDDTFVFNRFD